MDKVMRHDELIALCAQWTDDAQVGRIHRLQLSNRAVGKRADELRVVVHSEEVISAVVERAHHHEIERWPW
jgi:hypothetical protein